MENRIALIIIFLSILTSEAYAQQRFTDFESGAPAYFSTDANIGLAASGEHVKSGTKSIKWVATDGKKVTATGLNIPSSEVGSSTASSAQLFIYNSEASDDKLIFEFLDNNNVVKRTGTMLLNFKGWRDYHRSYRYDYDNGKESSAFLLNQCRITYKKAPGGSATKTLFFDNFKFIGDTEIRQPGPHMALDYQHFKLESAQNPLGAYLKKSNIVVGTASTSEISSLQIVKNNYSRAIGNVAASAVTLAKTYVANCSISRNADGSIKGRGILATYNPDTLVLISTHIQSLARAAIKNGDTDARSKLLLFTEYIIDQGIAEGGRNDLATNSYTNARTFPLGFLEALSLYPESLRTDVTNMLKWSHEYNKIYEQNPTPGQNTDFVHIKLTFLFEIACSLTSASEAVSDLKFLKSFLEENTEISQGFRDGIKPDGTGFHHNSHQLSYMYAFGTWAERAYSLKGTIFKISQAAYDNMVFAYKSIFLESSQGGVTANSESGRTPFPAKVPINQSQFAKLVELGGDIIGLNFEPGLAAFYNYTYKVNTYPTPNVDYDGFYASNYANMGVKKSGNWTAVMKGLTSYFFGSEIYPTQNRYGRYQSYGALEILYNGTLENSGYTLNGKGWDWNYMPGTTTIVLPFNKLQAGNSRADEYQVSDFVGALSLGKNGIFGMEFQQRNTSNYTTSNLKFKKSVFAFDDLLICLGSDISVTNNQGSVVSTLFQTASTTATPTMYDSSLTPITGTFASSYPLATEYKWLTSSQGTGFYLPQGNNDYRIELGSQTTPDNTSLTGVETNTVNFTRAYLVHGNQPAIVTPAKYEYVVAPSITATTMQTLSQTLASGSIYTVLNQDSEFHAIKYIPDHTTAYVFFKPKTSLNVGLLRSSSKPAIISIKEYETDKVLVTINSPDLNRIANDVSGFISSPQIINLGLIGEYTIVSNPNNATVNQQGNLLTVGFTLKDGFAATVLLQKTITTPIKLLDFKGNYTPSGIELNWTSIEETNVKNFVLFRSNDGLSFEKLATLNAKGNSTTKTVYNYNDNSFAKTSETIYYKLQSVDTDGTISSEKLDSVKVPFATSQIMFYPNPAVNFLNISFNAKADGSLDLQVFSTDGKIVIEQKHLVKKGVNLLPLNVISLLTGEYIIRLSASGINSTYKFIKI